MGTIPLGGAGSAPIQSGQANSIPIPEQTPANPTVLIDVIEPGAGAVGGQMPTGGLKDEVLAKLSNANYDIGWIAISTGGISQEELEEGVRYGYPEDVTINRTNGLISSIVTASRTVTITRDGNGLITDVTDEIYNKEIIRTNGVISSIDVTLV